MPRPLKRSVAIRGHRTSLTLEAEFWSALEEIAREDRRALAEIIASIDGARSAEAAARASDGGLSSAVRVYILNRMRSRRKT